MKQKKQMRKLILALALIFALGICAAGVYADDGQTLSMKLQGGNDEKGVTLYSQKVEENRYFMLPSGVQSNHMHLDFEQSEAYKTAQSANIGSVFFVSEDPVEKGMDYIHGSADHSTKAKGMIYLYDENFNLVYEGAVDALKGRGNTTWSWADKKPYQVKLEKKADLLEPVDGEQKSKTWILLSNPFDPTLIKNTMVYNFAKEIGLENTPDGRAVDLYYDGIYRGSYYLCEKVEVGDGRVEIDNLEDALEEANPGVDLDEVEIATAKNSYGQEYSYAKGLKNPKNIKGGYLLEIDNIYYKTEPGWISLSPSRHWVSKSPEYMTKSMGKYISEQCDKFYNYFTTQSKNLGSGKDLFEYVDKESIVKYYLTMEFFDNMDVWASSTYLYKPKDETKFYFGPVWDCDSIMGVRFEEKTPRGWKSRSIGKNLLALPTFRKAVQTTYIKEVRPVINKILLGKKNGEYLKTYENMKKEIAPSLKMNDMIWEYNNLDGTYYIEKTAKENYDSLFSLMQERAQWMDRAITADTFVNNKVSINRVKAPKLKANGKYKTIKVTIPNTTYKISNVAMSKSKKADSYQIAYRVKGTNKWKTVNTNGKLNYTLKKLKIGKTYQVKVRVIAKTSAGTKYGSYSKIKTIKIK